MRDAGAHHSGRPGRAPPRAGPYAVAAVLETFHPLVRRWFERRFGEPTEPQALGWPEIAARPRRARLGPDGLRQDARRLPVRARRPLPRRARRAGSATRRASSTSRRSGRSRNDVEKNLRGPLAELAGRARAEGLAPPDIRVAVRTGDTPRRAAQAMVRVPAARPRHHARVALPAPHRASAGAPLLAAGARRSSSTRSTRSPATSAARTSRSRSSGSRRSRAAGRSASGSRPR